MSSFFTEAPFDTPYVNLSRLGVSATCQTRQSVQSGEPGLDPQGLHQMPASPWPTADIPWGDSITTYRTFAPAVPSDSADSVRTALSDAQTALGTAQGKLSDALGAMNSAQAAVTAAQQVEQAADDALDVARLAQWKGSINVTTATRGGDPATISAAQARLTSAQDTVTTATSAYAATLSAVTSAQGALGTATAAWQAAQRTVLSATASVAGEQCNLAMATSNDAGSAEGSGSYFDYYTSITTYGQGTDTAFASSIFAPDSIPPSTDGTPQAPEYYKLTTATIDYRIQVAIDGPSWLAMQGQGISCVLQWSEVTTALGIMTVNVPSVDNGPGYPETPGYSYGTTDPTVEPDVSYVSLTETLSIDGAKPANDGTGAYVLYSSVHTIAAPGAVDGCNVKVNVQGPPTLPTLNIAAEQTPLAAQQRQGWAEYVTASTATYARRYLTLTASAAAAAPANADYSGSQQWVVPPTGSVTGSAHPECPLILKDTLSAAAKAVAVLQEPGSMVAPTSGATILSATQRVFSSPAGLLFTLSDEQTPNDIQTAVLTQANVGWDDPSIGGGAPFAMRLFSADGDRAAAQRARYQLGVSPNDERTLSTTPFSVTGKYIVRTTNLDTGAVSNVTEDYVVSYPLPSPPPPPAWNELPVPLTNQSVEIIPTTGQNDDPHTFGPIAATLVTAGG